MIELVRHALEQVGAKVVAERREELELDVRLDRGLAELAGALSSRGLCPVRLGAGEGARAGGLRLLVTANDGVPAPLVSVRLIGRPASVAVPGLSVAFVGPDGAGKSTVISACEATLGEVFQGVVNRHLRPGLLPPLGMLVRPHKWFAPRETVVTVDPHAARPSGSAVSLARLAFYGADYIVGYAYRVENELRRGRLVLFDRYSYDLAVDPQRLRIDLSESLRRRFVQWLPRPDLVVVLYADPAELHRRKPELPIAEIARQLAAYRALLEAEDDTVFLSVEGNPDAVALQARRLILAHQARRVTRALRALGRESTGT